MSEEQADYNAQAAHSAEIVEASAARLRDTLEALQNTSEAAHFFGDDLKSLRSDLEVLLKARECPVRPFEPVEFENGFQVTLDGEGCLEVIATSRKFRKIAIYPRTDASCKIGPSICL